MICSVNRPVYFVYLSFVCGTLMFKLYTRGAYYYNNVNYNTMCSDFYCRRDMIFRTISSYRRPSPTTAAVAVVVIIIFAVTITFGTLLKSRSRIRTQYDRYCCIHESLSLYFSNPFITLPQ